MELIPAIDVLDGKVVRLLQGRYDEVKVYSNDPVAQAHAFRDAGAERLHVVDLDGARLGAPSNLRTIEQIVASTNVAVQVGGGIRTLATARRWFDAGASRVVLGTVAVKEPAIVETLAAERPGGVVVAIDAKDGNVAVEGWLEQSHVAPADLARRVDAWGIAAILYTDIARDGTRVGPNVEATLALQREVRATVIASGGIGTLEHLKSLRGQGVRAAVCGRGFYEGAFTPKQAFDAVAGD